MRATAQHVDPDLVQVYFYSHPGEQWPSDPARMLDAQAKLERSIPEAGKGGGRLVLSFLDVVVPDSWSSEGLYLMLKDVVSHAEQSEELPHHWVVQDAAVRFWVQPTGLERWKGELKKLARHIVLP